MGKLTEDISRKLLALRIGRWCCACLRRYCDYLFKASVHLTSEQKVERIRMVLIAGWWCPACQLQAGNGSCEVKGRSSVSCNPGGEFVPVLPPPGPRWPPLTPSLSPPPRRGEGDETKADVRRPPSLSPPPGRGEGARRAGEGWPGGDRLMARERAFVGPGRLLGHPSRPATLQEAEMRPRSEAATQFLARRTGDCGVSVAGWRNRRVLPCSSPLPLGEGEPFAACWRSRAVWGFGQCGGKAPEDWRTPRRWRAFGRAAWMRERFGGRHSAGAFAARGSWLSSGGWWRRNGGGRLFCLERGGV